MRWEMLVQNTTHVSYEKHCYFLFKIDESYVYLFSALQNNICKFPQPSSSKVFNEELSEN